MFMAKSLITLIALSGQQELKLWAVGKPYGFDPDKSRYRELHEPLRERLCLASVRDRMAYAISL